MATDVQYGAEIWTFTKSSDCNRECIVCEDVNAVVSG